MVYSRENAAPAFTGMRGQIKNLWYWGLFSVESVGMAYIFYVGIPLYRTLLDAPLEDRPAGPLIFPVLGVAAGMQICYWMKYRLRPSPAQAQHPLLAHLLLFFSRLSFIFAASLLSLTLFRRLTDIHQAFPRVLVLLVAVFAQFCYSRELEALARRVGGARDAATRL